MKKILSERLKSLLSDRNISQQTLATALGISRPAVSQFCAGTNLPSLETVVLIADYFDVTTDYLLGRDYASLSPERQELVDLAQTLPDDKIAALLAVAKTIQ